MKKYVVIVLVTFFAWNCTNADKKKHDDFSSFSVMSYNVLYTTSVGSTYQTIKETGCDIVGLQEASEKRIKQVADSLKFDSYSFGKNAASNNVNDVGIISRFPIVEKNNDYVIVKLPNNEKIAITSVHLLPYPYEPYDIRDQKITNANDAVLSATKGRIHQLMPVLNKIDSLMNANIPVFITGDFNEASHLDWTEKAAKNKLHFGMPVQWPCSKAIIQRGLKDAYRQFYPDEVTKNGITWTTNPSENEVYDRIDFVYHNLQDRYELNSVQRVGKTSNHSAIVIEGYESDHFAVLAKYSVR